MIIELLINQMLKKFFYCPYQIEKQDYGTYAVVGLVLWGAQKKN